MTSTAIPFGVDSTEDESVMTPLGPVRKTGMAALRAFGEEAERREYPRIAVGGFIVPGREPAASEQPGEESNHDVGFTGAAWRGRPAREEAGPTAWARQRPSSPQAAAPGASPYALEQRLSHLNLDLPGLVEYHPLARVIAGPEEVAYFNIPLGLFQGIPIRARLTLEVPLLPRGRLSRHLVEYRSTALPFKIEYGIPLPTPVPDVRAWAVWEGGALHGLRVTSHHQNPDKCICACLAHQWVRSIHPLLDYVAFCTVWLSKSLHERLLGFYPGQQHYGLLHRVRRDRVDEYCGCGSKRRYHECCRDRDLRRTSLDRWRDATAARALYLQELAWQGRSSGPPEELLRIGLSAP